MNEQALKDAYDLFVQQGYNKSIDDFKQLIASNDNALKDSYNLFTQQGYNQSIDSYKTLLGVSDGLKKKEEPILPMAPQQEEVPSAIPGVQPKKPYTVSPSEDTSSELPSSQTDGTPITPSYVEPTPVQPEQGPLGAFNQKVTGPDYGGQITPEEQARAVKMPQPEVPEEEKEGYWKNFFTKSLPLGINQLDKLVASAPEAVVNALLIPQNFVAWATGLDIATNADKLGKDLGISNPILKKLNEEQEYLQNKIGKFNKENYEKTGIYENIKDGNYADAFALLGNGIIESAPISVAMMFGGATLSAAELTAAGTLLFSEGSREQLNETAPNMSEIEKTLKSLAMASAETVFSQVGTGTIGQVYKDIIKKEGLEAGQVVFKNGLVEMYKTALKKYGAPIGLLGEGIEEVATQVTQNVISGKPAFEGAADAFIVGGGSGVVFATPITVMKAKDNIKNIVETNNSKSEIKTILKNKPSELHQIFNVPQAEEFTPEQIQIANTNKSRDILVKNLDKNVKDGVISSEDAKQSVYIFDKAQQVSNAVKDLDISIEKKTEVANLLSKRNDLKTKIENKEDVLVVKEKQQIDQINKQISDIILEPKTEQNAIQEQTADESVLLGEQPEVGLQEVGEGNVQPEVTATGTEEAVTPEGRTQEVKEPSIVVHSTVNGFGLQHSEGINNENIVEPKDPRRFPETANPEERREFDKGNAVVTTDEVNDNGDKNISIISSTQDATGRAGGSVYDFMIPNGNTSNTENIKKIVTDVNKTDLKGKELINETIKQVKEYINSNKPSKEAVSSKTQPTTIQQELASMETMFGEQITPTVKPTTDQGVSVTNKSSVNDIKAKTTDKERVKVIEAAQRVLKTLKSVLPNFDIVLHNDEGSYNAAMIELRGGQGTGGNFSDNGDGTGRIDINLSKANSTTVAHEVAHAIMLKAFGDNPALFKGFRDKISKVLSESSNKELMDFANQYVDKKTGELLAVTYEEYLAELTGRLEQQQDKLSTTTLQRIAATINEIVSKLTNGTFKPFENIKDTKQIVDFFNNISQSIRKGEEVDLNSVNLIGVSGELKSSGIKSKSSISTGEIKRFPTHPNVKVVEDVILSDFDGKTVNLIESDRMVGGYIANKEGEPIFKFFGGVFFPIITGKWWASRNIVKANGIVTNGNKKRNSDGYIYSSPMIGSSNQHMSNNDMLSTTIELIKYDVSNKKSKVTKKDVVESLKKSFNRKDLQNKKKVIDFVTENSKTINEIFNNLESVIFQDGKTIRDKNGKDFLNDLGKPIENFTFEERKKIVETLLGDPKVKSTRFPSAGSISDAAKRFEEPITSKATKIGDIVTVMRTKGELKYKVTDKSDPFYHNSYPIEIYSENKDGSPSEIEVYILDGAYSIKDVFPTLSKSNGEKFTFEEYFKKHSKVSEKLAEAQYNRTAKLSYASGEVTSKAKVDLEVKEMDKKFPVSKSQIDLYHGTPYEIKQFSTEKIGTGEGAQEFGWGLYFTTVKDIAKHYASAISAKQKSDKKFVYDVSIHEGKSPSEYTFLDWNQKVPEDVKNKIRKQAKKEGILEEYSNKLGLKTSGIENIKNYVKRQFYVNKVIKLRESGISVSEAIKQVASDNNTTEKNIKDIFDLYSFKNIKGDYLYSGLSSELGSDKKASEFLLRAGIDGVKYPTSTISSVGVKSLKGSNYVVFDENAVTIKSVSKSQQDAVNVVNKIIKDARAQGFSEEAIKTFLEGKGMDPKDISEAMSAELTAAGKVSISEEMLPGYDRMMQEADSVMRKSQQRGASNAKVIENVMNYVKGSLVYEKATDVQREKLVRDVNKMFGVKEKSAPSANRILGEVKDVTKITMTEKQGLVKQIKDLARGAKSAKIAWMNISNLLTKEIKELESSGRVTAKQVSSIIRRFSSVNMFNEKSIEKFVGYMSNVFENAEYANKIDIARSLLTTAKKNIGTKIGIADGLILPLQRLFSINPNLIPESVLDKYLSLVDMFGKKQAVLSLSEKSEVIKTTQDILEAIDEEQSLVDELSDRFNASESKVLDEDGKIDYAASLKEMVKQEEITEEEADIMRKYKSDIVPKAEKTKMTEEEVAKEKKQLIDTLKQTEVNVKDLPTEDERKLAKQLKDLASTKAVEKLSNTELKNLLKVFDNINNNYLPHYAELMAEKLTAINDANSLTSAIKRAVVAPLSGIYSRIKAAIVRSGRTGIAEMIRRNPLFYVDQLFGDFKTKDIFNAVLNKVAEGESKFKSDLKTVQNILERAEERVAKSFGLNSNDTLMSKFKMMTYMVQLEHDSNQGSKQVNPAAEYLKATIKHIDEGKSQFGDRDANMLQQILKDFAPNGEIDNDKLYKSFNEAEKSAIKDIRGINESLKEKAEYTASIIRGDRINPLTNYVHLNVLHEHKPNDLTSGTAFVDDYNNSMKPSTKAKSLIERTGKVSPLNFDVFASAHKGAKFVLMDYNLTAPIRTARKTLKQTISNFEEEGRIPKEKRQIINAIDSAFEEATKNLLTNSFVTNSLADDFVNYINKQGYRAVLAGTSRFASELMSNIGFAVISDPKAFSTGVENKAFIMSADAPTFMKNVKSKETSRLFPTDTLSGKFIDTSILKQTSGISGGKSKNPVRNKIEQIWNLSGKKYVNSVELIADTLISTPDKLVMRPMWFGSFANEFKKITGENINFEKVSANDESYMSKHNEAIEKAKTTADERTVMTGATDNAFMGILKGTIKPDQSFTTRAFNNFNNFMTKFLIFEYVTARTGLMAAMGNGSLTKKQGAAVLAAVTTRMVVYTLLTQMLGTGLMGLIIGDDEEEEDEKSLMQKFGQALTSTFTSMIFGRDFGQATKAILNEGLERINENYLDFLREGDYDPYKDAIQYSIVPPEKKGKQRDLSDFLLNMGGAFGPALKTADFVTRKALEPEKQKEDAVERQENERSVRIPLEILGNLGLVPLYKDIRKAVLKDMYSNLETAEKTAANKKVIEQEKLHGYKNQSDMKRYDPELWDKTYGPNSTDYDKEQAIKEIKKAKQKLERETKDEMYNYVPKSSKAYKFGPQSSTGKSKSEYKFGPQSGTKKSEYKFGPK